MSDESDRLGEVGAEVSAKALLRTVIELSDDALITCDEHGRITYFSETAERLCGRQACDVVGLSIRQIFPEHLSDEIGDVLATVAAGERIRHFETEIVRPGGLPIAVSLSLSSLAETSGPTRGTVIVARDVTEQHLAQAMLGEIGARMEEGEALSHVGSWLWDLRTDVVQWSAEFHRLHGVDPLDFAGTFGSYMGLIEPDDRPGVRDAMQASVGSARPLAIEYRVPDADRVRVIRVHASPTVGSDGKVVGLRGIGQDVTDRSGQPADTATVA